MRILFLAALVLAAAAAAPALAAPSCYGPAEAEAEQGLRIHSELMVIGLNCAHLATGPGGQSLYAGYRAFTDRQAAVIRGYEATLERALGSEAALHALRTDLANGVAGDAANMRPDLFCHRYAPRMAAVRGMGPEAFRRWAATPYAGHPPSRPLCGGSAG